MEGGWRRFNEDERTKINEYGKSIETMTIKMEEGDQLNFINLFISKYCIFYIFFQSNTRCITFRGGEVKPRDRGLRYNLFKV